MQRLSAAIIAHGVYECIHMTEFGERLLDEFAERRSIREVNPAGEQMEGRVGDVLERFTNAIL